MVAGRNETRLVDAIRQQGRIVEHVLRRDIAVRPVLCFTGVDVGLFVRAFIMDGVLITWPSVLARSLSSHGVLSSSVRTELVERLAHAFPPYCR
jgi:hypothetical protein